MDAIARGMSVYLNRDVGPDWNRGNVAVKHMLGATVAPDDWIGAVIVENQESAAYLGYHDLDTRGRPYIRVFWGAIPDRVVLRDQYGKGASLCGCLLHEAAETLIDENANLYVQGPFVHDGNSWDQVAVEVIDPVQEQCYPYQTQDGITLDFPNYVLPAWFNPKTKDGPFDHLETLTAPLSLAPGGYVLVRESPGQDSDVMAKRISRVNHESVMSPWRLYGKRQAGARTAKRIK